MGILSWIAMGFIVGLLAKFIMPGRDPGSFLLAIGGAILLLILFRVVRR